MNLFTLEHWWLVVAWVVYCTLHSVLAAPAVKRRAETALGKHHRYYRIFYSVFAFLSLIAILIFQYSFRSPRLWQNPVVVQIAIAPLLLLAMGVMISCIGKYFLSLSGIDVFLNRRVEVNLQVKGLHRFVRHPLYAGTLLFLWCLFLLFPYLSHAIACLVITVYVWIGIGLEEKKLVDEYGDAYHSYASTVPRLFPDLTKVFSGRRA